MQINVSYTTENSSKRTICSKFSRILIYKQITKSRPDLVIVNKKQRTCRIGDFAVATDHRVNLKEGEKRDKYPDIARELKKLWNMKVTVIPIVIGALGTVIKGLVKGLEELEIRTLVETIQMTILLRVAQIFRRVLETRGD